MKILLTILCAIVVLFAGGCAVIMVGGMGLSGTIMSGGFALLPAGLAFLNVLVIGALWGKIKAQPGAFLALAIVDAIIVIIMLALWADMGLNSGSDNLLVGLPTLAIAIKGLLTFLYWRELRTGGIDRITP